MNNDRMVLIIETSTDALAKNPSAELGRILTDLGRKMKHNGGVYPYTPIYNKDNQHIGSLVNLTLDNGRG